MRFLPVFISSILCASAFIRVPFAGQSGNYLRNLEGKRKSRYSKSWTEKRRVYIPPIVDINMTALQQRMSATPTTSESGIFRLEKTSTYNFTSVGGYEEVKEELSQVIDFLKNPNEYEQYNVRLPRGILLCGPPGTGKTLIAKSLAGECGLPFIATSGSVFADRYVGVGSRHVRELFEFARSTNPCIVFIDELESLCRERSSDGQAASAERDQTLNQLLVEMDGFVQNARILVVGATNRDDILDEALTRSGRMDKIIKVELPDEFARMEIIDIHARGKPINVSLSIMVEHMAGLSGADIEGILNEAVLTGIRRRQLPVNEQLLDETIERLIVGNSASKRELSEEMIHRIATHEVGHVLTSFNTKLHGLVRKVTIESPNSQSPGYTLFNTPDHAIMASKAYLEEKICVLLGGRVAEEIVFGMSGASSGARQDLEMARKIAEQTILEFGFGSKLVHSRFSEHSRSEIDRDIEQIIEKCYRQTRCFLERNLENLLGLTRALILHKTMTYAQIISQEIIEEEPTK